MRKFGMMALLALAAIGCLAVLRTQAALPAAGTAGKAGAYADIIKLLTTAKQVMDPAATVKLTMKKRQALTSPYPAKPICSPTGNCGANGLA